MFRDQLGDADVVELPEVGHVPMYDDLPPPPPPPRRHRARLNFAEHAAIVSGGYAARPRRADSA